MIRVGIGTDRHRLQYGKPLILGGVHVDCPKGGVGHSDADTLTHAVIDALLGAAGLGDIGHHFPDTDPRFKGADSIKLLEKTMEILSAAGYAPVNVDASIHMEAPKLGRLKQEMATRLADAMKLPRHRVNVKAKTGEACDAVGKGECVDVFAIAQVEAVRSQTGQGPLKAD